MSTQKETVDFILEKLGYHEVFNVRAMFGEYALYAKGKVVALVCDDQLYVKILSASHELEDLCQKDEPYKGAKLYYLVEEDMLTKLTNLPEILIDISDSLPEPKKKLKRKKI